MQKNKYENEQEQRNIEADERQSQNTTYADPNNFSAEALAGLFRNKTEEDIPQDEEQEENGEVSGT